MDYARGRAKLLVINRTWELAPDADVLYSGDRKFWAAYEGDFAGRKISGDEPVSGADFINVRAWLPLNRWCNNSGAQALFLMPVLGATRVILTGYDMQGRHWHEDYASKNPAPDKLELWRKGFPAVGAWLGALGIEVLNATRETAIDCFPRVELREVLR